MSFASERVDIETRFKLTWTGTPIAWENVAFNAPNNSAWVKLSVLNGNSKYRIIGGLKRHSGLIVVQVFVPIDTGTSGARAFADSVISIFGDEKFSDVVCDAGSIETIGTGDLWHQINVTIPYWRDEQ
jgi:hypothetical protein